MNQSAKPIEILAPAGSPEAVLAAVRSGANAVYLGGPTLNARRGAANFDEAALAEAVSYCHARSVKVHLTVNTIVFPEEIAEAEAAIRTASKVGVDALIIQDLAVARIARDCAPAIALHASTQMNVHNLRGVEALERLGFSRVVLARELSAGEIAHIVANTDLELECFVHGALCMCFSGGCYLSSMIGGRSGNRGLCAQPCRLPFRSEKADHALSLRDLSLLEQLPALQEAGVDSVKIEGRLKRPEYVAAAVRACREARDGKAPDMATLEAVFSRSGFTDGYFTGKTGDNMFGIRRKEDVTAASGVLSGIASEYRNETPLVPLDMTLTLQPGVEAELTVSDGVNSYTAEGEIPQEARTAPTTEERAHAALSKTGGTPFYLRSLTCRIGDGLLLPASQLNALRREALEELLWFRSHSKPHAFAPFVQKPRPKVPERTPALRIRLASPAQYNSGMEQAADYLIVPLSAAEWAAKTLPTEQVILELPRIALGSALDAIEENLRQAQEWGLTHLATENLYGVELGRRFGMAIHGGAFLNTANPVAVEELARLGVQDVTASIECALPRLKQLPGEIPCGALGYGYLPLMLTRNRPAGMTRDDGVLTDRLGTEFAVRKIDGMYTLYNSVPLWLAERRSEFAGLSFLTLYFTMEDAAECRRVVAAYQKGNASPGELTRGLYYRTVN